MRALAGAAMFWLATDQAALAETQSAFQAEHIRQDVRVLSSDAFLGRGPGQGGEAKTLDYLVNRFRAAGLQPGAPGGAWLQDVPLTEFTRQSVDVSLQLPGRSPEPLGMGRDVTLASHMAGRTRLHDAPLVFVGYGVKAPALGWDSFAGADLHGKIAVVLANDPDFEAAPDSPAAGKFGGRAMVYAGRFGAKVAAAQAAGAAGVLVIHEDAAASYPWRQVANGDRIVSMAITPDHPQPTSSAFAGWLQHDVAVRLLGAAGQDLERLKVAARDPHFRPLALAGVTLSADFTVATRSLVSHNVIARLPGRLRPQEVVLYGAHWDANGKGAPDAQGDDIRNGAVDNATGTAELLEVASTFARNRQPARSVVFIAYTAEEKGLLGSDYYASHPVYPLATTVAAINLDPHIMLDRARDIELVGGGRTDLEDNLVRAAASEGLTVQPEPHPEAGWYFRSDHYSFSTRGVPSLSFRIGRDLVDGGVAAGAPRAEAYNTYRYHQPGDAFDPAWSFAGPAQEAAVAWRVGDALANSDRWPTWRPGVEYTRIRQQSAGARN